MLLLFSQLLLYIPQMDIKATLLYIFQSGMNQREIAEGLDCTQQYVSDLMSGKRGKRPAHKLINAITALRAKASRRNSERQYRLNRKQQASQNVNHDVPGK